MASRLPVVPTIVLVSALESFAAVTFISERLLRNAFLWTLIRLIALNVLLYIIYLVEIWPRLLSPLRHLPRPKGALPLLGHGLAVFNRPPGRDFLRWVTEVPNDGIIHFRGFFNQDRLLVTNPKALAEILVTHPYDFEKPAKGRSFLRRVLGDGLIIAEGDVHKFQRKNVMPVFSFRHLKELYPMMWKKAVALTQGMAAEIREQAGSISDANDSENVSGALEVNHWANKVTMDIIGIAAMGREFNALKNDDDELIKTYEEILEPTTEKLIYFASQVAGPQTLVNRLPWKINERITATTNTLRRICMQLVQEKREAIKAAAEEHLDILSVLIKSDNFDDIQLVDQMLTFLAAGHETTSSAFTWTTYLLAKNPLWQTKLREEIQANIAHDRPPQSADELSSILESLPILNAVCNETLRLYPTVPITIRDAMTDTTLLDQQVPVGTQLILSPWAVNRNPHLWGEDADKFKPERWVSEDGKPNNNGGAESNYSLLTFLHGPRSCIGQNFAKTELRCLVATFTSVFEWEMADPNEDVICTGVITTKPANGMHLRLNIIGSFQ
ncbi:putative P450 monooxygenase [Rhizodiscina lignyota]|uniref:P450 monooxygenase n=1 Tax=Rhizodiscina lignyota TaxID=1504668 RepID=A0A9P4INJ3_9PEZI|nr:putative P450 monooxygenase [Rhizodiscina lignyota]